MDEENLSELPPLFSAGDGDVYKKPTLLAQLTQTFLGVSGRSHSSFSTHSRRVNSKVFKFDPDTYEKAVVARQPAWMQDMYVELVGRFESSTNVFDAKNQFPAAPSSPPVNNPPSVSSTSPPIAFSKPPMLPQVSQPFLPVLFPMKFFV
jgi:hypothetical protein